MIKIKLNLSKIDKEKIFIGKKGKYIDLILVDKPNDFGDGFITQSLSKEERDQGLRGVIVGNWQHMQKKPAAAATTPKTPAVQAFEDDSDIPF